MSVLLNPRRGQTVTVRYRPKVDRLMPYHGRPGVILVPGRGRTRNHLVEIDGRPVVVPAGNLFAR